LKDYPLIKFSISFVSGILLYEFLKLEVWQILTLLIFLPFVLFLLKKYLITQTENKLTQFLYVPVFILFGLLIATLDNSELKSPLQKYYKEKKSCLYAEVKSIELSRSYEIAFNVIIDSIFIDNKFIKCNDELICKFRGDSLQRKILYDNLNPGNKIYLTGTYQKGREQRNPFEFDYNKYLSSKGITGLFVAYETDSISILNFKSHLAKTYLHVIRKKIDNIIHSLHQPHTAGLLRGLLLADRSEIDYETKNEFINSGVVHILAVSGLHVGYILIIFLFIFGRFGIYTRSILTIAGLLAFMFITGVPPSVFRATIMSIVIIFAFLSNRGTNLINSISIAAFIIVLADPGELYNPGFQLSFSAVLSIAIVYPKFQNVIKSLQIKSGFIEKVLMFIAVSLSAQIGTLPFTLAYFSKLSVIALLTNIFVIPTVGIIIGIAFITVFTGSILPGIAIYFASANDLVSSVMISFIKFTGKLDFSFLWVRNYSLYDSIVFYFFFALIFYSLSEIERTYLKFAAVFTLILVLIYYSAFDDKQILSDNQLSVLMIDVGQGDAFLIKFPNGKTALVDAGEANAYIDNGERIIIPLLDNFGIEKIDYGFISHLDLDHYGGFVSLIYNDRIKEVYLPLADSSLKSLRLEKFLKQMRVKANYYSKSSLVVGNTKIYFLNNPDDYSYKSLSSNDRSGVLKVVYGKTSFLFVGDCEHPAEYLLAKSFGRMLDSDVLKVGHHGSPTGSSESFLKLVSPKISLVSAGIKNKFNHPSKKVISSLKNINSKIYRTDLMGAILLQSDGNEIKKVEWK
jgi:competence protein ComEC